jgi:hypothetical protein
MYLDGSAAVLLFLLGFAEVQLAVMGWKLLVLMMTCTLASGFDLQFSGAAWWHGIMAAGSTELPGLKFICGDILVRKE